MGSRIIRRVFRTTLAFRLRGEGKKNTPEAVECGKLSNRQPIKTLLFVYRVSVIRTCHIQKIVSPRGSKRSGEALA